MSPNSWMILTSILRNQVPEKYRRIGLNVEILNKNAIKSESKKICNEKAELM
jgi:hypothetical protein